MPIKYRLEEKRQGLSITCLCCKEESIISTGKIDKWKFCPSCGIMWDGGFKIDYDKQEVRRQNKFIVPKAPTWNISYTKKNSNNSQTLRNMVGNARHVLREVKKLQKENPDLKFKAKITENKKVMGWGAKLQAKAAMLGIKTTNAKGYETFNPAKYHFISTPPAEEILVDNDGIEEND